MTTTLPQSDASSQASSTALSTPADSAGVLRVALVVLALASVVFTATELAMLRHWNGFDQVIPWIVLGVVAVAAIALLARRSRGTILAARIVGLATLVASAYGVIIHVHQNYETAPLDFRYTDRWPDMSELSRYWAAFNGSVGASPPLAPAALAFGGLCLVLATIGMRPRSAVV